VRIRSGRGSAGTVAQPETIPSASPRSRNDLPVDGNTVTSPARLQGYRRCLVLPTMGAAAEATCIQESVSGFLLLDSGLDLSHVDMCAVPGSERVTNPAQV
jgi:hypothetical protein